MFHAEMFDFLRSTKPCRCAGEAGMGGRTNKAAYHTCSLSARVALPLILTRICSSSPSVSAAWGYQTRPLGMPMGQVEDPSYGIRGGAAGKRSVAGAPSSEQPTTRKGYKLQVTFPRCPGGRKPYTSNSFVNEDGDLFKTPQLLISANTLEELHGNLPTGFSADDSLVAEGFVEGCGPGFHSGGGSFFLAERHARTSHRSCCSPYTLCPPSQRTVGHARWQMCRGL